MKNHIRNLFKKISRRKLAVLPRKSKAQSLTEFAIALPILILLLSGVVEYGFALNYYLSLLDATRESARYYSKTDPFLYDDNRNIVGDNSLFYGGAAGMVLNNLDPTLDPEFADDPYVGRIIPLNPETDEVIVTVYSRSSSGVVSYPTAGSFRLFASDAESLFTSEEVAGLFESDTPDAGLLIVEVHYTYNAVMNLPWISPLFPMKLRAYTIMPLPAADP
ncbi:MAG: pilus assembly protein [Anaerolineales bacterium]|nr:pilus assembly protein [Anaerolineales bacterium]